MVRVVLAQIPPYDRGKTDYPSERNTTGPQTDSSKTKTGRKNLLYFSRVLAYYTFAVGM